MSVQLDHEGYLDHIGADTVLACELARGSSGGANPQVPNCPEWSLADLLDHLAHVHNFWATQLEAASETPTEPSEPEVPPGAAVESRATMLEAATERLLANLRQAPPERVCWNWSGKDQTAAWVARRMALETAVHRADAEQALGLTARVEAVLAVDGIDERIDVHLACDVPEVPDAALGGSLCLACSDVDQAWVVEVGGGRLEWREGRGPADAVLVGSASDLYLFTWNRIGVEALSLTGRRDVADAWATLPV